MYNCTYKPMCWWINFTFILSLRPRPPYQGSPPWKTLFPNWHKLYNLSSPPMLSHILGKEENQNFHCIKCSGRFPAPGSWPIYLRMEVDSATVRGPWVITCNIYKSRIWKRVKGCGRFTGNFLKGSAGSFQCWPLGFIFSGDFCQTQYYVTIKQSHSFTKRRRRKYATWTDWGWLLHGEFWLLAKEIWQPCATQFLWGLDFKKFTKDKKDERFTCLGGTSCHKIAWGPSWILIIWNNRPFMKEFHQTVRQLVSVHLAERTGRSRPPCTLWLDQNRQLCIHRMLQFHLFLCSIQTKSSAISSTKDEGMIFVL